MTRGASDEAIQGIRAFTMRETSVPDTSFQDLGKGASKVQGWIGFPVTSPVGIVGVEFRNPDKKEIVKHYLSSASWSPTWIGTPDYTRRCFETSPLWVVEGVFDLFPLLWAVPHPIVSASKAFLTRRQVDFIVRFAKNGVRLVLDNDEYGNRSLYGENGKGLLAILQRSGVRDVRPVTYSGKDPGEVWNRGGERLIISQFSKWV
jgi:hypothetical protein